MYIISWNVNGLKAIMKKDFRKSIDELAPDIICLQETKAQVEDARTALSLLPDYHSYVNSSKARKGYSGTAIISKKKPLNVTYDIGIEEHDQEGRVITAEFEAFYLVTVYVPNSGRGLDRLAYRQKWDKDFLEYLLGLEQMKPVIICGDLNVAHQPIDLARPKNNYNKTAGYTQQEIDGLDNLVNAGFVDSFRYLYPEKEGAYSWWSYMFNAKQNNVGWRIDYFMVSEALKNSIEDSVIHPETDGSDHCPVGLRIDVN
ncbi:MAG: exodeoxyribonuclease III [Cyclobacteriaceae bacterium]